MLFSVRRTAAGVCFVFFFNVVYTQIQRDKLITSCLRGKQTADKLTMSAFNGVNERRNLGNIVGF